MPRLHEPGPTEARRNGPGRVSQTGKHDRHRAHHEKLPAYWQRRVVKKAIVFGLVMATRNPREMCTR